MTYCYWFGISLSESPEGQYVRSVHPEINFRYCKNSCSGIKEDCPNFPRVKRKIEPIRRLDLIGELS